MLIKRVLLRNVKSYERAEIPFQPGINFVCGENGAGKTTIIEAVGYCLFGHLPYNLAEFLRNGRGKGSVEVVFTARDGCDYQVTREFDAKTSKSPRVSDGAGNTVDLHGNADYDAWFRATAGLEPDMAPKHLFEQVLGVSQGTFAAPFLQSAGVRRSVFDGLFRVNSFRNAHDRALPAVSALRDRIITLEKDEALTAQRLEPIPAMQLELADLRSASDRARSELGAAQAALAGCEREASNLRLLADEVAAADKRAVALEREVSAVSDREGRLKQDLARCEEAQQKVHSTFDGHQRFLDLAGDIVACETRVSDLGAHEKALQAVEKQLADVAARAEQGEAAYMSRTGELAVQRQDIASQLADAEGELARAEGRMAALNGHRDRWRAAAPAREAFSALVRSAAATTTGNALGAERSRDIHERLSELEARLAGRVRLAALAGELPAREAALRATQAELAKIRERHALISQNRDHALSGRCPFLEAECPSMGESLAARFDELLAYLDLEAGESGERIVAAEAAVREAGDAERGLVALEAFAAELKRLGSESDELDLRGRTAAARIAKGSGALSSLTDALGQAADVVAALGDDAALPAALSACSDAMAFIGTPMPGTTAIEMAAWAKQADALLEQAERAVGTTAAAIETQLARRLADASGEARGTEAKVNGLRQQAKAAEAATATLATRRAELDTLAKRNATLGVDCTRLRELAAACGDPRADLARLREQQSLVAPAHEAYIRHMPDAERLVGLQTEAAAVAQSLASARGELAAVMARLNGLKQQFQPERLGEAEQQARLQHARVAGLQQQLADLAAREHALASQLAELESLRTKQAELAAQLVRHREALAVLEAARQVLNSAGEPVAEHFRRQVAADADRIQRKVAGDAAALVWDRDYEVALLDSSGGTERRRVFAQLSGGEQMTVALALRIALLRFLSPIRVGFFDEPTVNLDTGRRMNLATMLRNLAGEVGQLFLISHDDTFDSITENVTYLQKVAGATSVREEAGR